MNGNNFVISRTPYRVSFLGGGTDYPNWYLKNSGSVLSISIDKYCYLTVRWLPPFFEHKHFISYRNIETPHNIDEIQHPGVRETLRYLNIEKGVDIHHAGDLPARSGMGTSSSFTVGLVKALEFLQGINSSKLELASKAIHIEQSLIKENVGSQDQVAASFGGFNRIDFHEDGKIDVIPIRYDKRFEDYLLLFFTGLSRTASLIAKEQVDRTSDNAEVLKEMHYLVGWGEKYINNDDYTSFGRLLDYNWSLKKKLSAKISSDYIDFLYEKAIKAGALGGKLLGAGGGGFLLFLAYPHNHDRIKMALSNLLFVPLKLDYTGSQIIYDGSTQK